MADVKSTQDKIAFERMNKLIKYAEHIKTRVSTVIPEKHQWRKESYKQWLELELKRTNRKIEKLKG